MSIKSDIWIRKMAIDHNMIRPFVADQVQQKQISYGVSSYGYDFRVADEYKILKSEGGVILDPKKIDEQLFTTLKADTCLIAPSSFVLGRSVEYFKIPRNTLGICTGKSTYARCGIVVNVTPLEPEWEGFITLSIINAAPWPVKIYSNEGLGQILFLEASEECLVSYKDKKGKYQKQRGIVLPKVT